MGRKKLGEVGKFRARMSLGVVFLGYHRLAEWENQLFHWFVIGQKRDIPICPAKMDGILCGTMETGNIIGI